MSSKEKKTEYGKPSFVRTVVLLVISFVLTALSMGTYAWFSYRKRAAGIETDATYRAISPCKTAISRLRR